MPSYNISGRVVGTDGEPISGAVVSVLEIVDLTDDTIVKGSPYTTNSTGLYSVSWTETTAPPPPWDLRVRAVSGTFTGYSHFISDLESSAVIDLVVGEGTYTGRSEWDRVAAKVTPLIGTTAVKDIPVNRLEWLSRRADVFPTHLAAYIQAHRLAYDQSVKPESCYAFLRAGLPADLSGLVRAGEAAWESALRNAWTQIILPLPGDGSPEDLDQEVTDELVAMRELQVDAAVATPTSGVNQRIIFDTAGLDETQQRIFAGLWLAHSGPIEDFWTTVSGSTLAAEVPLLQFTVQAATLVSTHVSTLTALQAERSATNITAVADTAEWSVDRWDTMLEDHTVVVPDTVPGANSTEKRQNYARSLFNVLEAAYPTASVRASIDRDELATSAPPNTEFLVTFLGNNPDFDLIESTIARYLDTAVSPWADIDPGDQAAARANLETLQRIYRLTPPIGRYATAKVLLEEGLTSAAQIVASTRTEFVARFAPLLPDNDHHAEALAGTVWDNAARVHALTVGLASQLALAKSGADFIPIEIPSGTQRYQGAEGGLGELSTILGGLDYCACEHCRSVFSPAAYLTDLLAFLQDRPAEEADNALEVLLARRPDVAHILLDCSNTNIVLPYVDLVNELLESYIDGDGTLSATSKQTTWTEAELRLHPEHLDATVYAGATMTQTLNPWTLPFSLPTVETQTYLRHLGIPRHELMRRTATISPTDPYLDAMAGDVLGLSAVEFAIAAGLHDGHTSEDKREYWGFEDSSGTDNWVNVLKGVDGGNIGLLMLRAWLQLDELQEVLAFDFINPAGTIVIVWGETCSLDDASIPLLDDDALDRIHRFVRLQRACRIPPRMLNVLIRDALGGTLDRTALRNLAEIVRLRDKLEISWDELATFWADVIDARAYEAEPFALYTRRFLSKDLGPIDPDFVPEGSMLAGEEVSPVAITTAQLPRVLAGLGIKEREYKALVDCDLANSDFSFANFTALFRCVVLSRALGLSIADFVRLAGATTGLTALDPFVNPTATLAFVEQIEAVRTSGFSVNELDWLLRHQFVGSDPLDSATVARTLGELARGLNAIEAEALQLVDPTGDALAKNLPEVFESEIANDVVEIVDRTTERDQAGIEGFIDDHLAGILTVGDVDVAKAMLGDYENTAWLEVTDRRAWLVGRVVAHLRRRALVIDTIAAKFGLPATVAEMLSTVVLTDPGVGEDPPPLFEVYRLPFATEAEIDAGTLPGSKFSAWTRLAKAALVCVRFGLRADQVEWYSNHGTWLNINTLPLTAVATDASFDSWEKLRKALALRSLSRPGEIAPAAIAEVSTLADAIEILADHAGWDAAAVLAAAEALGYDDEDAPAVADEVIPTRLKLLVETADRLGVAVDVLSTWAATAPTMTLAADIKAATRAKYGEDRWPEVAKPLRDSIRDRQRRALVDAALSISPSLHTPDDLFGYLLIDVEMSPCMMTSRIKQAIASAQIFIHRSLLHLESEEITFDPEAIERWDWMKNYRVWEANRRVFLYPENWIEPELRADKTPEFEELEADLMQGVLDQRRVEKALAAYLEKLARVANLEIIGVHEVAATSELWLLGRTHDSPHEWFVRRRVKSGTWEPWLTVPASLDSDAAAMMVVNGRLHLFWVNQEEIPKEEGPWKYKFRTNHIEWGADGWGKPTVSKSTVELPLPRNHSYRLHLVYDSNQIKMSVLWQRRDVLHGQVGYAAGCTYRLAEQRFSAASYLMSDALQYYDQLDLWDDPVVLRFLDKRTKVGLPFGHEFDGQRNTKLRSDDNTFAWVDENAAEFTQGSLYGTLFANPSQDMPTFVHQASIWTPVWDPSYYAAVYDDRKRKYLLKPQQARAMIEINPVHVGTLDLSPYIDCPPVAEVEPIPPARPELRAQKVRDGIRESQPYGSSAAPNQFPQLAEFVTFANPVVPIHAQKALLDQCHAMATASTSLNIELQAFPVGSGGFWLEMTELYHPFVRDLQDALASKGLLGVYAPPTSSPLFRQLKTYDPFEAGMDLNTAIVRGDPPIERFNFEYDRPYGTYNWEIFYHVPMLLANKLATEQRWEEAQSWYHLIFNPIDIVKLPGETASSKFWRIKPFVEEANDLASDQFDAMLGIGVTKAQQSAAIDAFAHQVAAWEANPFDPHAVARVRPGVYQRALLREYFDNLLAWADHLFRQDTIESITEATVLYIMMSQLLGRRPLEVPSAGADEAKTFAELNELGLDPFSNAAIALESWIHLPTQPVKKQGCDEVSREPWVRVPVVSRFWYFCYPPNPEMLKYWDLLADRLFKIRHCQNIDGVERQLPLFEPPIDPALLVQATAAGIDIKSVLAELDSGLPPYRFRSIHARASSFAASLRSLGGSLLSALEKHDAEALSRIRSGQELEMLARVREIRTKQRDEARSAIESHEAALQMAQQRQSHYSQLMLVGLSPEEQQQFDAGAKAQRKRSAAQGLQIAATIVSALPQISFPPRLETGGLQLANVMNMIASGFTYAAAEQDYKAGRAGLNAGHFRRAQDWSLQTRQATLEIARIKRDIIAAKIRLQIAERELDNHALQVQHAHAVDEYMRSKFTNTELYVWMIGELTTLYFQSYQLAFDLAKRAERAYRHELAVDPDEPRIIQFGYWDSLQKGLLAGERLGLDLERLDLAYMDRDIREFELRKSVSLAELDPSQLNALREGGMCTFELPEALFDLDHPGHYLRRIRSVRLTIPAVVGPYTSLGANLQLVSHKTRVDKAVGGYAEFPVGGDGRFGYGTGGGQSIATSTAVSDGGLFNLDFKDERYLPFEYAGAISTWKLELPGQDAQRIRQFDYRSIEDVVIHIDYTARQGGGQLRAKAEETLAERFNELLGENEPAALVVSVHEAFPNEWEQFFAVSSGDHVLSLPMKAEHFPYFARHNGFEVTKVGLILLLDPSLASGTRSFASELSLLEEAPQNLAQVNGEAFMTTTFTLGTPVQPGTWTLTIADSVLGDLKTEGDLDPNKVVGMLMVLRYTLDEPTP